MKRLPGRVGTGALILTVSLLGCGSSGGAANVTPPATCGMVVPCGGDLTGTWKALGGCSDALYWEGILTCPPNTPEELMGLGYSGTVTFNVDLTYSTNNLVGTGGGSFTIPNACLPVNVACDQVTPYCSGASTCTCPVPGAGAGIIGESGNESGNYSVSGNAITFSPKPAYTIEGTSYCVEGELLHLETYITIIQSDGTRISPVTSDIVLQKQ